MIRAVVLQNPDEIIRLSKDRHTVHLGLSTAAESVDFKFTKKIKLFL